MLPNFNGWRYEPIFWLTLCKLNGLGLPADFAEARSHLAATGSDYVQPVNAKSIAGYTMVQDIYSNPAFLLRTEMPRTIYQQGRASELYFVGALLLAGIVFGIVIQFLLERSVISRLSLLNASVQNIASSGNASARVASAGRDEISSLGEAMNRMLQSLELSQKQEREAKELAEAATLAKSDFLALMSHEIRTPLNGSSTLFVWRFDRFVRSTKHLLTALGEFRTLGIQFISYQKNMDPSTSLGRSYLQLCRRSRSWNAIKFVSD